VPAASSTGARPAGSLDQHAAGRVAAAAARELREQLERPLLGAEVGQREPGVGVDDRGERDACEVVALGDHLRAEQDGAVGRGEAPSARGRSRRVRVEPDQLELGSRAASSRSSRCVPAPSRASSAEPHSGRAPAPARRGRSGGSAAVVRAARARRRSSGSGA
jgi:hypothetical protein